MHKQLACKLSAKFQSGRVQSRICALSAWAIHCAIKCKHTIILDCAHMLITHTRAHACPQCLTSKAHCSGSFSHCLVPGTLALPANHSVAGCLLHALAGAQVDVLFTVMGLRM
eukprot:1154536-Pelagomonas_calceolata.AAC.2